MAFKDPVSGEAYPIESLLNMLNLDHEYATIIPLLSRDLSKFIAKARGIKLGWEVIITRIPQAAEIDLDHYTNDQQRAVLDYIPTCEYWSNFTQVIRYSPGEGTPPRIYWVNWNRTTASGIPGSTGWSIYRHNSPDEYDGPNDSSSWELIDTDLSLITATLYFALPDIIEQGDLPLLDKILDTVPKFEGE